MRRPRSLRARRRAATPTRTRQFLAGRLVACRVRLPRPEKRTRLLGPSYPQASADAPSADEVLGHGVERLGQPGDGGGVEGAEAEARGSKKLSCSLEESAALRGELDADRASVVCGHDLADKPVGGEGVDQL